MQFAMEEPLGCENRCWVVRTAVGFCMILMALFNSSYVELMLGAFVMQRVVVAVEPRCCFADDFI